LSDHGDEKITDIIIHKRTVAKLTTNSLQLATFGNFKKIYKKYNNDDEIRHVGLFCKTECNTYFFYEKMKGGITADINDALIDVFEKNISCDNLYLRISLPTNPTVMELFENTRKFMGDYKYFSFRCITNNCTNFAIAILKSNNLDTEENIEFVNEHVIDIYNNVPNPHVLRGFSWLVDKWIHIYRKVSVSFRK